MEHYYQETWRNIGRINEIRTDEFGIVWIDCETIGSVHESCCLDFVPQVGMLVELLVDDGMEAWILRQVKNAVKLV